MNPERGLYSLPEQRFLLAVWLLAFLAAVGLTALVALEPALGEKSLVREVQTWPVPGQAVSDAVRAITGTQVTVVAAAVLAALHWLTRDRRAALVLVALVVLLLVTQSGVKALADRPRPAESGIEATVSFSSPSFPAGHVMSPTVVYGWALALAAARRLPSARVAARDKSPVQVAVRAGVVVALAVVLVLTGIVSVHTGAHWPTDVAGGYVWGLVLLLPALYVYELRAAAR